MNGPARSTRDTPPRRALIAPDSFKGTFAAGEVAAALARGFARAGWEAERCPLGDGGAGTAAAMRSALGGQEVEVCTHDPLGREMVGRFVLLGDGETAVVETACASGLALLKEAERDPLVASTGGTGELIVAASRRARRVLVAVGDSATNDGGTGALAAIGNAGGIGDTELICLCDVQTPWERAASTFAPQKGADAAAVAELERRLEWIAGELPRDPRGVPNSGAGGGLAGGLWARLGARLVPGAAYVCDAVELDRRIAEAAAVLTGEGRLDATTLEGKVVSEVAGRCRQAGAGLHVVVGRDASTPEIRARLGVASVVEAGEIEALERAAGAIAEGRA